MAKDSLSLAMLSVQLFYFMNKNLFLLIFGVFFGCTNQHNNRFTTEEINSLHLHNTSFLNVNTDSLTKVNLNPFLKKQSFNLGDRLKDMRLVPLETTDESLLGEILKVIVAHDYIYVHDKFKGGGLVIFSRDGKFVRRIPYGQGPGELFNLHDVAYDEQEQKLIAYQHPFLTIFTSEGQIVEQVRLPFGFYNFAVIPDGYLFKTLDKQGNEHLGDFKDCTLLVSDKKLKLRSAGLPYGADAIDYGGYHYLYCNTRWVVTQRFTDTIYQYMDGPDQLYARYVLDYNKKKLPKSYVKDSKANFFDAIQQHDYYYYLGEYLETADHNVFFLMNDHIGLKTIVYRDRKSGNLLGGTQANYDDVNEIPPMSFPITSFGNYFISCHFPSQGNSLLSNSSILRNEDKQKIKNLTEEDNPVLVLFKLKPF